MTVTIGEIEVPEHWFQLGARTDLGAAVQFACFHDSVSSDGIDCRICGQRIGEHESKIKVENFDADETKLIRCPGDARARTKWADALALVSAL